MIFRFGTAYKVESDDCTKIVAEPIYDLALHAKNLDPDLFTSLEQLWDYAKQFRVMLDSVKNHLPEVDSIHLFASVPVGMAFLMGQEVGPNIHPNVYTYEYKQTRTPRYALAFALQDDGGEDLIITEEDRSRISELRRKVKTHFEKNVQQFVRRIQSKPDHLWLESLFPNEEIELFDIPYWTDHIPIDNTIVLKSRVVDEPLMIQAGDFTKTDIGIFRMKCCSSCQTGYTQMTFFFKQ